MNLRCTLIALAVRTLYPRPRPRTPLQESAAQATLAVLAARTAHVLASRRLGAAS